MKRGFTLIEVVVSVALLLVVVVGGYQGFVAVFTAISHSHYRMTATDLANEHFETIRNLPYTSVGVVGGNPAGLIPVSQTIVRGSVSYLVTTAVVNVNDPFDGNPDTFPADYKLVEVTIVCQSCNNFSPIIITGQISPANLESN